MMLQLAVAMSPSTSSTMAAMCSSTTATMVTNPSTTTMATKSLFSWPPPVNHGTTATARGGRRRRMAAKQLGSSSSSSSASVVVVEKTDDDTELRDQAQSAAPPTRLRRLILLRHAQSSSQSPSIRDHDRPLSKAGQEDAVKVSLNLQRMGWIPELILSSDAVRTRQTLKIMQEHVRGFLEAEVHFISSFYSVAAMDGQTAEHLQQAICKYARDEILTVMCMGHNRGWEEAASIFSGSSIELKTCNAALLEATGKSWGEAFSLAGFGGWKLQSIVKPNDAL